MSASCLLIQDQGEAADTHGLAVDDLGQVRIEILLRDGKPTEITEMQIDVRAHVTPLVGIRRGPVEATPVSLLCLHSNETALGHATYTPFPGPVASDDSMTGLDESDPSEGYLPGAAIRLLFSNHWLCFCSVHQVFHLATESALPSWLATRKS